MWKCHKCGKPVYFAERKQSLGYDWHPECLRCEECGKRLNPGQHAEHKGIPYCHVPCYGALFGPQLFGHGTRVESHKSYGQVKCTRQRQTSTAGGGGGNGPNGPTLPRDHLESKLKVYNQFYDNKSLEIRSREVNNRLILEGALRVYWGVQGVIHLKEDDDQRTFVVRKRNSCRVSKASAADDSTSDKENEIGSESVEGPATTTATASVEVDGGMSTDISLSESMTFDTCSLNEYNELPTTPEDVSATTTTTNGNGVDSGVHTNGQHTAIDESENTESSSTLCGGNNGDGDGDTTANTVSTSCCVSSTLPSKLDKLEKLEWDEIDDLLQVERRYSEKDKIYETMPVKLPSSSSSPSTDSSSASKTASPLDGTSNSTNAANTDEALAPSTTTPTTTTTTTTESGSGSNENSIESSASTDNFITATASLSTTATGAENTSGVAGTTTETTTLDNFESVNDDATLKPMDYEDFKRSVHQDYLSGANSLQQPNDDTLKKNQPIDPSRIHDSLKLYGESNAAMSKSFNCEHALRSIDPTLTTLKTSGSESPHSANRFYALQKSGSATTASSSQQNKVANKHNYRYGGRVFDRGINRSKSGPSFFDYTDSDDDDDDDTTLRAHRVSNTVRRSDIPQRYIRIEMDCYPKNNEAAGGGGGDGGGASENESSRTEGPSLVTNSGSVGGDELTQTTEDLVTAAASSNGGGGRYYRNNTTNGAATGADDQHHQLHVTEDGVVLRRPPRSGANAIKRRSGNRRSRTKLKRRCSINGHFYNRETSFFTPPYGSQMSVWVTSLVNTQEVINLLLEKYKVDSPSENFSLFIVRDNGEQKRLKDNEYPLITRVMLGPHEDVARLFLVDAKKTEEISNEVAQFINLSIPECRAILERYDQELEREVSKIRDKYAELRRRIAIRMESLKVHL